ncbi:hypothetical protein LDENG_00254330 [Lucifuga dentata]|nr:hypothetical protein LDENG_00254330 [Lucifuga dentata]
MGAGGDILNCNSSGLSCMLTGLVCGQHYDILMTASDGTCVSPNSDLFRQSSVPCPPVNVTTNLDCGTNLLMVSWNLAAVPLNYTVTAMPLAGHISAVTCHSNNASCSLSGLQCGHIYNVSVRASHGSCSGACSAPQTVHTVPCTPQSLATQIECGTNSLLASWNASLGATSYTATVMGPNGFYDNCTSSNLTCSFAGLQCASYYNVTVTSQDSFCTSSPRPCDTVGVTNFLLCDTDAAIVSWNATAGAVAYTVLAKEIGSQHSTSCRNSTTLCVLNQLNCGKMFSLTVLAEDTTCNSTGSTTFLMTAPCPPVIQDSSLICGTNSTSLSWSPVVNATGYIANATSVSGHTVSCNSSVATCTLTGLLCSETYTATVVAQGSQCHSAPSPSINFTTIPCAPENVSASLVCWSHSVLVTWEGSPTALTYNVTATGQDGHTHHCHTNTTSCQILNIHCGEIYNIIVTPHSQSCAGPPSAVYSFTAGLCPPSNVTVSPACEGSTVSWSPVTGAEMYIAIATADDGHTHNCSCNNSNSCNFTDLHCGETYSVTVVTVDRGCWSVPSPGVNLTTVPCAPENVSASLVCWSHSVLVTWEGSPTALTYNVTATGQDGHTHHCHTNTTSCQIPNIHCGEIYNIIVTPHSQSCAGPPSAVYSFTAAPCPPDSVQVQLLPMNNEQQVMHFNWTATNCADTEYLLELTGNLLGDDQYQFKISSYWTTLTYYETPLPCSSSYNATVKSRSSASISSPSEAISRTTAPCPPSGLLHSFNSTVTWNAVVYATNYTVYNNAVSPRGQLCDTAALSCSVPGGLTNLVITASNAFGESEARSISLSK